MAAGETPEQRAMGCLAYVNAVGFEDGSYGGPDHEAYQRLLSFIADAIREAVAEDRETREESLPKKE